MKIQEVLYNTYNIDVKILSDKCPNTFVNQCSYRFYVVLVPPEARVTRHPLKISRGAVSGAKPTTQKIRCSGYDRWDFRGKAGRNSITEENVNIIVACWHNGKIIRRAEALAPQ